jgi:hypothetical protein
MVRKVVPEIVDIVDTTDHTAGKKPFYQRTQQLAEDPLAALFRRC